MSLSSQSPTAEEPASKDNEQFLTELEGGLSSDEVDHGGRLGEGTQQYKTSYATTASNNKRCVLWVVLVAILAAGVYVVLALLLVPNKDDLSQGPSSFQIPNSHFDNPNKVKWKLMGKVIKNNDETAATIHKTLCLPRI